MKITARELSNSMNMDYGTANLILRYMVKTGAATIVEKRKHASGRGKPTNVYEVGDKFVLVFPITQTECDRIDEENETARNDKEHFEGVTQETPDPTMEQACLEAYDNGERTTLTSVIDDLKEGVDG